MMISGYPYFRKLPYMEKQKIDVPNQPVMFTETITREGGFLNPESPEYENFK